MENCTTWRLRKNFLVRFLQNGCILLRQPNPLNPSCPTVLRCLQHSYHLIVLLTIVYSSEPFAKTVHPWALLPRVSREEHLFGNSRGWIWDRYDIEGLIRPETLSLFKKISAWPISVTKNCAGSELKFRVLSVVTSYGPVIFVQTASAGCRGHNVT